MKKTGFFIIPLFFLLFSSSSFADEMQTGNATTKSTVINNVQGNGSVTTHIENTVNGQTTTVDSNQPGKIVVENNNGTVVITKTPEQLLSVSPTPKTNASPTMAPKKIKHKVPFISNLFENLSNFLSRIIHNL